MRSRLIGWEELGRVSVCVCVCVCVIFAFMLVLWTYHCASRVSGSCDFPRLSVNVFLQFELVIQFCISVPRAQPAVARFITFVLQKPVCFHLSPPNRLSFTWAHTWAHLSPCTRRFSVWRFVCFLSLWPSAFLRVSGRRVLVACIFEDNCDPSQYCDIRVS